jgi:CRISPR-associated RAMP protein (TIGR02581 family)
VTAAAPIKSHAALHERVSLRAGLVAKSAIHVGGGAGGGGIEPSDLPVARDGAGRPYIPGSSLRGSLRSSLEALLRGVVDDRFRVCDPFCRDGNLPAASCSERVRAAREDLAEISEETAHDLAWKHSCEICRLFGHSFFASRVRIADLPLETLPGPIDSYVRDGVGIDRDLRSASLEAKALFQFEAVPAGSGFRLRLEIDNPEEYEVGLLLTGLDLLSQGFGTVGGKAARGLGWAEVSGLELVRRRADDFFSGSAGADYSTDDLTSSREAARLRYANGGATTADPAAPQGGA